MIRQAITALMIGMLLWPVILMQGCDNKRTNRIMDSQVPPEEAERVIPAPDINANQEISGTGKQVREGPTTTRLASNPRLAVMYEAILAVTGWDWTVSKSISGNAVSDWNYLYSDLNAYNTIKSWYGSYASVWSLFYTNPYSYGFYGGYGRYGQCVAFANAIYFRSGVYQYKFPTYDACYADLIGPRRFTKSFSQSRLGDLLRSKWANGHTAVIVKIIAGVEGVSVTAVDVIDANFVGGMGQEIIGRHIISTNGSGLGNLNNYYAVDLIALGGR